MKKYDCEPTSPSLTLADAQLAKEALERDLETLVADFQQKHNLTVSEIRICLNGPCGIAERLDGDLKPEHWAIAVKTKIEL